MSRLNQQSAANVQDRDPKWDEVPFRMAPDSSIEEGPWETTLIGSMLSDSNDRKREIRSM